MNFKRTLILFFLGTSFLIKTNAQDLFTEEPGAEFRLNIAKKSNAAKKFFSIDRLSIGFGGGINFSLILPLSENSIFTGIAPAEYQKDYSSFVENVGSQFQFLILYDINNFLKLGLQPSSNDYVYKYTTSYEWTGNTNLIYETLYTQRIRMYEVPLMLGLYLNYGNFQPYFQGGGYYGRLVSGISDMSVVETSSNLAGSTQSLNYTTSANSGNLYQKNHYGLVVGSGIAYLFGRSRLSLEADYKVLLSDLNSDETAFVNNQVVSGNYDVPDKFKFSNLSINLILVVPLKCKNGGSSKGGAVFCE
ncbi:MAG: hypothetical protein U0W24_03860 [Bacteroidales bacterium]